jgi:hypothetical protein
MDSEKRRIEIRITDVGEIRMGAPYNSCDIELVGADRIKLPIGRWQDKWAWTADSKNLVLIKWGDFENGNPDFHLFLINTETGKTKKSPRLYGLPEDISITGEKVKLNKFVYNKEKSSTDKLCCVVEEEYEFT